MTEALAHYKKKGGSGRSLGGSLKGKKKKAGMRLGGAKRVTRKKKAGGPLGAIGNAVINTAGTIVGVVVGGVYKAGKAAAKQLMSKKGGATREQDFEVQQHIKQILRNREQKSPKPMGGFRDTFAMCCARFRTF